MAGRTTYDEVVDKVTREHAAWITAMAAHFDKMVSASMNNAHADTKHALMAEFISGLQSHFKLRWGP